MKKLFLLLIAGTFFTFSCEKALFEEEPANTPVKNFDQLWSTIDKKYAFFEYKSIDWDSIRRFYRPQVSKGMSRTQLFDVLSAMLGELNDGHVNLISEFDVSRYWDYYLDYPANFDYDLIQRNYLGDDYEITGPFKNIWLDNVGYIYYGSFQKSFNDSHINYLLTKYNDADGLIIDVRNNGGGYTSLIKDLAGHFTSEKYLYAKSYFQNGPAHDDFTSPDKKYIEPADGERWQKPIILLTNRRCYSATNTFVLAMKQLDHVTVLGDKTGGGGGIPISSELPNGWTYRFSASKKLSPDGFNIENGIAPNENVSMNENDMDNGKDTLIERAMDLLEQKN